jgi:hypothetical protein
MPPPATSAPAQPAQIFRHWSLGLWTRLPSGPLPRMMASRFGAGEGNRTLVVSLGILSGVICDQRLAPKPVKNKKVRLPAVPTAYRSLLRSVSQIIPSKAVPFAAQAYASKSALAGATRARPPRRFRLRELRLGSEGVCPSSLGDTRPSEAPIEPAHRKRAIKARESSRQGLGTSRVDEHYAAVARSGQEAAARSTRSDLRLVHRDLKRAKTLLDELA